MSIAMLGNEHKLAELQRTYFYCTSYWGYALHFS
uniref:Uncharacterized protein n=1 Tax=Arundo donax TaxID=35708 RepID=A0A0A9BY00_ARUDO